MEANFGQFQARLERVEALFATDAFVYQQGNMVWIDFVQYNEEADQRWLVSRVVLHPGFLDDFIAALSEVRGR